MDKTKIFNISVYIGFAAVGPGAIRRRARGGAPAPPWATAAAAVGPGPSAVGLGWGGEERANVILKKFLEYEGKQMREPPLPPKKNETRLVFSKSTLIFHLFTKGLK